MSFKKTQFQEPDLEKGAEESTDDDSDNNDKFWKLFVEEAVSEAKWKVGIWTTELDSLLVFAGLFAGVVSAFLIDLRSHLQPDPQVNALTEIISILRNDTAPLSPNFDQPSLTVRAVGSLWYGSLVVTLIGALLAVLAKGWLGEILREAPNNPADRALERWWRDNDARDWFLENVITGVPLLTQVGLAMFLAGFVVQSFNDNHAIGLGVLVFVAFGVFAYALLTFLPWFRPDCPFRTPLTNFLHLVPTIGPRNKVTAHEANIDSKIQILVSRLNRSSNDEIFCAAASILDVKLESHEGKKWYKGIEGQASEIAGALSVRLNSFAHRIETITKGSSSTLTDASTDREAFVPVGSLYSPIEQGLVCLHALLKSMEASVSSESVGNKPSPWIKQDIERQWRSSEIFPVTWRLLATSIHITRLVFKKADYDKDDIVGTDWEGMIRKTFSDLGLRSISGASACRGLLQGKGNLRRVCALGLAMFIEIEATTTMVSPKEVFFDKELEITASKIITEELWSELVKLWKNAVVQLLREPHEWDEKDSFVKVLDYELYESDIKSSIPAIVDQLGSGSWSIRKQAVQILTVLSEHNILQETPETRRAICEVIDKLDDSDEDVRAAAVQALSAFGAHDELLKILKTVGLVPKLITALADDDSDVRAAAVKALLVFSTQQICQSDIQSSIPSIVQQLHDYDFTIRKQTVELLIKLSDLDVFQETIKINEAIPKLVSKLADDDSDVYGTVAILLEFSAHDFYHSDIKSSISVIIQQLENNNWSIREKTILLLSKLSELDEFPETIKINAVIPKLVSKLADNDSDVRNAAAAALLSLSTHDMYQNDIQSSIPTVIKQMDDENWIIRQEAINMLKKLSEYEVFHETINANGAVTKLVAKLDDEYDCGAAVEALSALGTHSYFQEMMHAEKAVPKLLNKLSGPDHRVGSAVVQAMSTFSAQDFYTNEIKASISVSNLVKEVDDESWSTRQQTIQILTQLAAYVEFREEMHAKKVVPVIFSKLTDSDEDVRAAAAQAVSVFGQQAMFQETMKSEKTIPKLVTKLADTVSIVRAAAQSTLLALGAQEVYQNDIKSAIPAIIKQVDDKSWSTRQQAIQTLTKLSEIILFQETLKTGGVVTKFVAKLGDHDEDVRAAAAQALSSLGSRGLFQENMKAEKAVPKLITKLTDVVEGVRSAVYEALIVFGKQDEVTEFLQTVMSTLNTIDEPARMEVYKVLIGLRDLRPEAFVKEIDKVISDHLTQMKDKDLSFIRRSIAILTETADKELRGEDLRAPNAANKSTWDAVEIIVRSKLVYNKNSPDRNDVVEALSQLAKNEVFLGCMKPAIQGLTEAVSNNDRNVWSAAVGAISALSRKDEFRADLVPAVQKLIEKLSGWDDEEQYPLGLIDALSTLVHYKDFQSKLKTVVPILINRLENSQQDARNDTMIQDCDEKEAAFYKAACKFISLLCESRIVGRDLVPHLTRVLPIMNASLTEDFLGLVDKFISNTSESLTINDRIALASSLRVISSVPMTFEVQVCKLNMAALLDRDHKSRLNTSNREYSSFLTAVLGNGNDTVKSKLSSFVPTDG